MEKTLLNCLQALSSENDADYAIQLFLQYLGEYYRAHRIIIFEIDNQQNIMSNSYEWLAFGVPSQKASFQKKPLTSISRWLDAFSKGEEVKMVSLKDVTDPAMQEDLASRGIENFLMVPLRQNDQVIGFLGRENASCKQDEPLLMRLAAYLISAEFQKKELTRKNSLSYADSVVQLYQDMDNGCFIVHYQPLINLKTGELYGAEALCRKLDDRGNLISPQEFIPMYEEMELISLLDIHMMEMVCSDLKTWKETLGKTPRVSVNFSRHTLLASDVVSCICKICERYEVSPGQISIEVTEHAGKLTQEELKSLLSDLQKAGFSVSLDDFGTEYSNLSILTAMDFQLIKLDKTLIHPICTEKRCANLTRNLIELCRDTLSTPTLAEGVETKEQAGLLRDYGCDYAQGFYFSMSVPVDDFTKILREEKKWDVESLPQAEKEALYSQTELLARMAQESGADTCAYLIRERRAMLPDSIMEKHSIPNVIDEFPLWLVLNGHISPDDVDTWLKMFDDIEKGISSGGAQLRMRSTQREFADFRVHFTSITDDRGKPHSALFTFEDITAEVELARKQQQDINGLLRMTRKTFPEVLTLNLSSFTYRIIQYDNITTLGTAREGDINDMLQIRLPAIVEEDRAAFLECFTEEHLERAFLQEGRESLSLTYRRLGKNGEIYWFETTIFPHENIEQDDFLLVAASRHMDVQKAEENRLREELYMRSEEIRITSAKLRRVLCTYDVATSTLFVPEDYAKQWGWSDTSISNYPECALARNVSPAETLQKLADFYNAIRRGEPTGSQDVKVTANGNVYWRRMEFATVFDWNHKPIRAVIFVDDITELYSQTEENRKLKENERMIALLAKHSDRSISYYDPINHKVHNGDGPLQINTLQIHSLDVFLEENFVFPESRETAAQLYNAIRSCEPEGQGNVRARLADGTPAWLNVKYTTFFDENLQPLTVIISIKDVTKAYTHELAYLRHKNTLAEENKSLLLYMENDLTADQIEATGGRLLSSLNRTTSQRSDFIRNIIRRLVPGNCQEDALQAFSRKTLLEEFELGNYRLTKHLPALLEEEGIKGLLVETFLLEDPFSKHIKTFTRVLDNTEQLDARQEYLQDSLTGLLNRTAGEKRIRQAMETHQTPGLLILMDMDNLKTINDTFGHSEGDVALTSMANVLTAHFRESDVICRMGGDEFLLFLPEAADEKEGISLSLARLLRKFSGIYLGDNNSYSLHCSIGCVSQQPGDTFEDLFRRADIALYHVKRSGRNNFAFYTPEMEQENYEFKAKQTSKNHGIRTLEPDEMKPFFHLLSKRYALALSFNLNTNQCRCLLTEEAFIHLPDTCSMDEVLKALYPRIYPDDRDLIPDGQALREFWQQGQVEIHRKLRYFSGDSWRSGELVFSLYNNLQEELCGVLVLALPF